MASRRPGPLLTGSRSIGSVRYDAAPRQIGSRRSEPLSRHAGRQYLLFAQHLRAVELRDRGPAQFADLLGDALGARFELRCVEVSATLRVIQHTDRNLLS